MSKKKTSLIVCCVIVALVVITAIFAIVHFTTRDNIEQGSIVISVNEESKTIKLDSVETTKVEGTVVNGKGEEKPISGEGIELKDLIETDSFESATIYASDEYSAVVSADEIFEDGKVYLMLEDGKGRLVVFGDKNSKRNVSDVVKIVVE